MPKKKPEPDSIECDGIAHAWVLEPEVGGVQYAATKCCDARAVRYDGGEWSLVKVDAAEPGSP